MPPTYLPLHWESTGEQWWYASPVDWAAANGHYDLVRELLRIDTNHLINLTSLRRIRRLETLWDDQQHLKDVSKHRSQVAHELFLESESNKRGEHNSLINAGYGGWLMYTAAAAGDSDFVQLPLERNPLLVFGEGEYGITDILYAAARGNNCEIFRILLDFAVSPRFKTGRGGALEEHIGDIPSVFKREVMNRAVHAASRGGNVRILEELLFNCSDVLAYRDNQGSTLLHAAAGKGQVEVIKYLTASYDIIGSTDHQGNTVLHMAAYKGQLESAETLVSAFPSLISMKNNSGETFLHKVVSGFKTCAFRRLDRQVELMKQLIGGKMFHIQDIVNIKNNDGRTALHMAIIGNVRPELVQLLMTAQSIDVNACDVNGMTPLDYLRQRPSSASSDILIRRLVSAGGMFCSEDYAARRVIDSHLKICGNGSSPGTSFRISDTEILLYTGIENTSGAIADQRCTGMSSSSSEMNPYDRSNDNFSSTTSERPSSVSYAANRLKQALRRPRMREKKAEGFKKSTDEEGSNASCRKWSISDEAPALLRRVFLKPSSFPSLINTGPTLSVRSSNESSTVEENELDSGTMHGVTQSKSHINIQGQSYSSSFSKPSMSSANTVDKMKGVYIDDDVTGSSFSNQTLDNETPDVFNEKVTKEKLRSHYFCFGVSGLNGKNLVARQQQNRHLKQTALSVT